MYVLQVIYPLKETDHGSGKFFIFCGKDQPCVPCTLVLTTLYITFDLVSNISGVVGSNPDIERLYLCLGDEYNCVHCGL